MGAAACRPKPPEQPRSVGLEWPRMTAFWFWIIVAIAFAIAEVMTVAFFAVFLSVGALAAGVVSLLGFGLLVQAIVLGGIGVVGIFAARPFLVERLHLRPLRLESVALGM